jgi:hypothetical protein
MMSTYYTGAIDFKTAGGTAEAGPQEQSSAQESRLSAWLAGPQARPYEGQWVMFGDRIEPIDADLSPTALKRRHEPASGDVAIVFVRPTSLQIGA